MNKKRIEIGVEEKHSTRGQREMERGVARKKKKRETEKKDSFGSQERK